MKNRQMKHRIGGWLLLCCIWFVIVSPLLFLAVLLLYIAGVIPFPESPWLIIIIMSEILRISIGIYVGNALYKKKVEAIRSGEKYLLANFIYVIVILFICFLGLVPFLPFIWWLLHIFISATICYSYFSYSKHVKTIFTQQIQFRSIQNLTENMLLLLGSSFLFALAFPSFLNIWGFSPLGFICLVPIFTVIHRSRWSLIWIYGIFFGILSNLIYNFWLAQFHPLALTIVLSIYSFYFLLLFPLLKAADSIFPQYGYLLQSLIWVSYEFLKSMGFVGYPYGNLGYSQYLFLPLIRIAAFTGVWGVSLIVIFPNVIIGNALKKGVKHCITFLRSQLPAIIIFASIFLLSLFYGILSESDLKKARMWKVACIQSNIDPWKEGTAAYERYLTTLIKLSEKAIQERPEIVIWSETALVPSIRLHTQRRMDQERYNKTIRPFLEFMDTQEVPYLIGNDDGEYIRDDNGKEVRIDYNATMLMQKREIQSVYRKIHLVPFTEHFPFADILPGVYEWLKNADTHFWEEGKEYTVFQVDDIKFSTPICYEDVFGDLCQRFVKQGAQVLVNLTNDAWSNSVEMEMQHMSIAVFRAVENKKSLIRSTTSGITCVIDPNGRIMDIIERGTATYLVSSVPINKNETTLYTFWGDWFALIIFWGAIIWAIIGILKMFLKLNRKSN